MNNPSHLSDHDLQMIVADDQFGTDQVEFETHISNCKRCQTRLLAIAADDQWRADFNDCLSGQFLVDAFSQTSAHCRESAKQQCNEAPADDFDLASVDAMLAKILHPPIHPETLGRLGRYEVESVIGCGGMGVVLRGYDRELQRPVAIKLILPRLSKNGTAKQRFAREARAAAAILHPNVIAIHGIDETDGVPWFSMPLILGPSLRELVKENGPLPEKEIVRIGLQIASGLAAAHSQGLVHRDIKPENILVDNRVNRVVITDFGLARRDSEEPMTQTGVVAGTLNYMSPEQSKGKVLDGRSDLFSLGSLLYYLATGVVPFRSETPVGVLHNISNEKHPDIRELNPDISGTLTAAIDRLLEKDPSHRFQSAVSLESFFEEYVAHLHQPLQNVVPSVPKIKRPLSPAAFALRTAAAVAILLGVWFAIVWWMKPVPVSPELLWSQIQTEYGLDDSEVFRDELASLGSDVRLFESQIERLDSTDGNSFIKDAAQCDSIIERIDNGFW